MRDLVREQPLASVIVGRVRPAREEDVLTNGERGRPEHARGVARHLVPVHAHPIEFVPEPCGHARTDGLGERLATTDASQRFGDHRVIRIALFDRRRGLPEQRRRCVRRPARHRHEHARRKIGRVRGISLVRGHGLRRQAERRSSRARPCDFGAAGEKSGREHLVIGRGQDTALPEVSPDLGGSGAGGRPHLAEVAFDPLGKCLRLLLQRLAGVADSHASARRLDAPVRRLRDVRQLVR